MCLELKVNICGLNTKCLWYLVCVKNALYVILLVRTHNDQRLTIDLPQIHYDLICTHDKSMVSATLIRSVPYCQRSSTLMQMTVQPLFLRAQNFGPIHRQITSKLWAINIKNRIKKFIAWQNNVKKCLANFCNCLAKCC